MTGNTDLLLAMVHHLLAFALAGVLAAEIALTAPGLTGAGLKRLGRLDAYYGALAGLLIAIGVLRVIYGGKGPDFYIASHAFWAKMAAFIAVGLLSIPPTLRMGRWRRSAKAEAGYAVPAEEVGAIRKWFVAEVAFLACVPVFAAMMARGL
jgi:putative membrane protein